MNRCAPFFVVCLALVVGASPMRAEPTTRARVERFLAAYAGRDAAALGGFYGPDSVLRDPTAAQLATGTAEIETRGAQAIVAHLTEARTGRAGFRFEVEHEIVVGALAVIEGVVHRSEGRDASRAADPPGQSEARRLVMVLRFEGDRVVEHTEYHDYRDASEIGAVLARAEPAEPIAPIAPVSIAPPPTAPQPTAPAPAAPAPVTVAPPAPPLPEPVAPAPEPTEAAAPGPVVPIASEKPALTLEEIEALAIIPVLTDGELDDEMTVMLAGQLREKKPRFDLVSERQVVAHFPNPAAFSPTAELTALLAAARSAGAQAILLGQSSSYRVQSDYGNRLRLKIIEVERGTVVWSGGGWGTGGVSWDAARKRSIVDAVRQIP